MSSHSLLYPKHAYSSVNTLPLPLLLPSYYPTELIQKARVNVPKTYISYTYRLLKQRKSIGINRQALVYINQFQVYLQEALCSAIVHLLWDTKKVTVQEHHLRTAIRVLAKNPVLLDIESRIDLLAGLGGLPDSAIPRRTVLADQYGLLFPPSRFRVVLLKISGRVKWRVSVVSSVASATAVQVFTEHVLYHAERGCLEAKKRRITVEHVQRALKSVGFIGIEHIMAKFKSQSGQAS